jgi:hypothetical protein
MGSERPEKPPPGLKPRLDRDHFKGLKTPAPSVRNAQTHPHDFRNQQTERSAVRKTGETPCGRERAEPPRKGI